MKIAVIGGAGLMGPITVRDLSENPEVEEILIADYQEEKAKGLAASFKDPRIKGTFIDGYNIDETAKLIDGYDVAINSAIYYVNIPVMQACLKAGCHYNDLGGMFYTTQKQLRFFDDFKKAGLTAVLCMGSAPGTTNILARYAYDRLDEVEKVHVSSAGIDLTDTEGIDIFKPPYSLLTIMEEFTDNAVEFIDGEYKGVPALSGFEEISYPEPIGRCTCFHTLHSEPATLPSSFKDKGVKEVVWKLGLPAKFFESAKFLASVGLG
ncbi:saccharopine dehydrogenase NADP-binding domain-containing protein, partial [bacterium]|nr:saccharopine dehydrogenase NADP-binding domain-containing protein [bacterium]